MIMFDNNKLEILTRSVRSSDQIPDCYYRGKIIDRFNRSFSKVKKFN